MFEYLGLAYRDSDYTAVIAIMPWPECKKLVLKLTLVVEIWALLSAIARALSSTSGGSTVPRKGTRRFRPHGRDRWRSLTLYTPKLTVLAKLWVLLMSCLRRHCSRSTWAWLPRGVCVNWNELRYLACATASRNRGCNAATRSAVAPRII